VESGALTREEGGRRTGNRSDLVAHSDVCEGYSSFFLSIRDEGCVGTTTSCAEHKWTGELRHPLHALSGQPNVPCRRGVAPLVCNCRGKCWRVRACLSLYLFGLVSLAETENQA
jgi:hypothetical protein